MKKWYGELSEKLHLLVGVFIVHCDFEDGVDVGHFTGDSTTRNIGSTTITLVM